MRKKVAASFAVLVKDNKVLVAKRTKCGRWGFFGGRIDEGENARTSMLRELEEEAGLFFKPKDVELLYSKKPKSWFIYKHNFIFKPKLNEEHKKVKWCTLKELKKLKEKGKLHYSVWMVLKALNKHFKENEI